MMLKYEIVEVSNLSNSMKDSMYKLLEYYYANVRWRDFISDLMEKQWAILLFSTSSNQLVGFSTQMCIVPENKNFENCVVLYSGDTIIAHEYWGSITLPIAFLELVSEIKNNFPGKKVYWLLISKGLRTFKFLSVFLNDYYPNPNFPTPLSIKELMDAMGQLKFGKKFNSEHGIIKANDNDQYLKKEFQPEEKKENEVATFFFSKNPGYFKGDELLCMAEISDANLHPFIKRLVSKHAK